MLRELQVVSACRDGVLPVAGGLLDQPARWFEISQILHREENLIENERAKRK